jgi:tRNA wybutosine-synthesizing protein 3
MEGTDSATFLHAQSVHAERLHAWLKSHGWLSPFVEPVRSSVGEVGFPLTANVDPANVVVLVQQELNISASSKHAPAAQRLPVDPHLRLRRAVSSWLTEHMVDLNVDELVPTKWEKLGDLVLLPVDWGGDGIVDTVEAHSHGKDMWRAMAEALKVDSLGVQAPIASDTYRSAQVRMLLGSPHVVFTDHGIVYSFDASKVMFSSGNITERRRIGALDMSGETVVDAYAGVGYYTFPMLVHSAAARVHACEINPASLEGLRAGAEANGLLDRLIVHEGDNARSLAALRGQADRCHLGLLPSSESVWEACLLALKPTGGTLHVHMNVEEEHIEAWVEASVERFQSLIEQNGLSFSVEPVHLERVKWFAPRVRHVVLDLNVRP